MEFIFRYLHIAPPLLLPHRHHPRSIWLVLLAARSEKAQPLISPLRNHRPRSERQHLHSRLLQRENRRYHRHRPNMKSKTPADAKGKDDATRKVKHTYARRKRKTDPAETRKVQRAAASKVKATTSTAPKVIFSTALAPKMRSNAAALPEVKSGDSAMPKVKATTTSSPKVKTTATAVLKAKQPRGISARLLRRHFDGSIARQHGALGGVYEPFLRDADVFAQDAAAHHKSFGVVYLDELHQSKYRPHVVRGAMYRN